MSDYSQDLLRELQPKHDFFIGIDSDGCAFDTMELKHKECFIPNIIKEWNLQAISKYTREAAEFVNLYSRWRGINRFPALVMAFDLLKDRDEVKKRKVSFPDDKPLRDFIDSGKPLGNPSLKAEVEATGDPILTQALKWSEAVNDSVKAMVRGVPPFPFVRKSLEKLDDKADMIVVSATPTEALTNEWNEHDIAKYMNLIAGQELGKKNEHLSLGAKGKYADNHILMIGDAPGDMKAAKANNVLFYPIKPGFEEESWEFFYNDAVNVFLSENYEGEYEAKLIEEFEKLLPETPPWKI